MEISENEMRVTKLAYDEFLKQKIKTNLNIQYELDLISPYCTSLRLQREDLRQRQASKMGTLWLWLTISPKNDIDFETFRDKISTFAQRKMFDDHIYVFEQRGKTVETAGDGFHAHLLLKRNMKYKQNKIISNSKNTFKKITNVENHDIFNFHWCPEEYLNDKQEYILGTKTGNEKDIKQEIDKIFRQNKNLKEYYKPCLQSLEPQQFANEPQELPFPLLDVEQEKK
ncbi:MAG: putative replication initiation protein [Circular genetic element sp.]|nr:MAG: putative replication initiation protein [Circular genetic element sp.]